MTRSGIKNHGFSKIWRSLLPVISVFHFFDFTENTPNRERKKSFGTQKSTFLIFFLIFLTRSGENTLNTELLKNENIEF